MEKLVTIGQAAKLLEVSKSSVYRLTYGGLIPALKVLGTLRIKEVDLENYIEEQTNLFGEDYGFDYINIEKK